MGAADRLTRINELLKREIAELLERNPCPGAGNMLVSVTTVHCSVDLRNATVYVSVFGGGEHAGAEVLRHLARFRSELQRRIARDLSFKHTPVLTFRLDDRMERGDRVLELLNEEAGVEASDEPQN